MRKLLLLAGTFLLVRQIARLFSAVLQARPTAASIAPTEARELVQDPVCGAYIAPTSAVRQLAAGRTLYYCSNDCRQKHAIAS